MVKLGHSRIKYFKEKKDFYTKLVIWAYVEGHLPYDDLD